MKKKGSQVAGFTHLSFSQMSFRSIDSHYLLKPAVMASPTAAASFLPTPHFLMSVLQQQKVYFQLCPFNTQVFQWLFQFNFPSFHMSTELLAEPSIHKQAAVGKVQASRGTKAASQSRLCTNCRHIMPYCQGRQLTAGDRAPDVGAIWFPVATGISGMEGEVVCSTAPQPAWSGVCLPQELLVPQRISSLQRDLQLRTPLHCLYLGTESLFSCLKSKQQ